MKYFPNQIIEKTALVGDFFIFYTPCHISTSLGNIIYAPITPQNRMILRGVCYRQSIMVFWEIFIKKSIIVIWNLFNILVSVFVPIHLGFPYLSYRLDLFNVDELNPHIFASLERVKLRASQKLSTAPHQSLFLYILIPLCCVV